MSKYLLVGSMKHLLSQGRYARRKRALKAAQRKAEELSLADLNKILQPGKKETRVEGGATRPDSAPGDPGQAGSAVPLTSEEES